MDVAAARRTSSTVFSVRGDIDLHTAPGLETALREAVDRDIVLDLSETTFLDSTALGVLVGIDKQLRSNGHRLTLVCSDPRLLKIFRITRLDAIWPIIESLPDEHT